MVKIIYNKNSMKHTYKIEGMTCNNCKASVEKYLHDLPHISHVAIYLEKGEAEVTMDKHISSDELQNALPEKYTVSEKSGEEVSASSNSSTVPPEKTKLQQLKPLLLILFYITLSGVLLHYKDWSWSEFTLDFMGLFYIVFGFFKMLDLKGFSESFKMYDLLANRLPIYGWIYPFIETALGIMFIKKVRFQLQGCTHIQVNVLHLVANLSSSLSCKEC